MPLTTVPLTMDDHARVYILANCLNFSHNNETLRKAAEWAKEWDKDRADCASKGVTARTTLDYTKLLDYLKACAEAILVMAPDGTILSVRPSVLNKYLTPDHDSQGSREYSKFLERLAPNNIEKRIAIHSFFATRPASVFDDLRTIRQWVQEAKNLTPRQKNILANTAGLMIAQPSRGAPKSSRECTWNDLLIKSFYFAYPSGSHSLSVEIANSHKEEVFGASICWETFNKRVVAQVTKDIPGVWDKLLNRD